MKTREFHILNTKANLQLRMYFKMDVLTLRENVTYCEKVNKQ